MADTKITDLDGLPGPILLDGLLQSFLLGTIVNQAFKYSLNSGDDSIRKRVFVATVISLSMFALISLGLQTMLEDYKSWRSLIQHKKWSTSRIQWADLFLNGCICWLCEAFYIRRCWKMMEKRAFVLVPFSILSLLIMSANVYLAIAMGLAFKTMEGTNDTLGTTHFLLPSIVISFSFWIFGSLVLEIMVSSILIFSLWRSRTGLKEIDRTVLRIIHMTWETSVVPSICMIIGATLYHGTPQRSDHLVVFFVLLTGKFYTFGVLRTLNSRVRLRQRMQSHDLGRTSLTGFQWDTSESQIDRGQPSSSFLDIPIPSQSFDPLKRTDSPAQLGGIASIDPLVPFVSALQIHNVPVTEPEGAASFRQRICS